MKLKTAVFGYVFGVLAGGYLVASVALMGTLGQSYDSLLYTLHMSPFAEVGAAVAESFGALFVFLALQVFAFWGMAGALATQCHLPRARRVLVAMLALHLVVALAQTFCFSSLSYSVGSLGWTVYVPYAVFMVCLLSAAAFTWRKGPSKVEPPAEEPVQRPYSKRRTRIAVGLLVLVAAIAAGVVSTRAYRSLVPFGIHTLDVNTGKVKPVRAAGDTLLIGVDQTGRTFTSYKEEGGHFNMRVVSFDGKLKKKVFVREGVYFTNTLCPRELAYSVETGRFATGMGGNGIRIVEPEGAQKSLPLPDRYPINLFWVSKDSLLVASTANLADQTDARIALNYNNGTSLHLFDVGSGQARLILEGIAYNAQGAALAPDGVHFAFSHLKDNRILLEILNLDTGERRVVAAKDPGSNVTMLRWSPDGRRLAWAATPAFQQGPQGQRNYFGGTMGGPVAGPSLEWVDLATWVVRALPAALGISTWGEGLTFCGPDTVAYLDFQGSSVCVAQLSTGKLEPYVVPANSKAIYAIDGGQKLLLAR